MKPGEFKQVTRGGKIIGFIGCKSDFIGTNNNSSTINVYRATKMKCTNITGLYFVDEKPFDTEQGARNWIKEK